MAVIQVQFAYSIIPNTSQINMQYGIQYSGTINYSNPQGVANTDLTIGYSPLYFTPIVQLGPSFVFTVPQGNANYYFAYVYFGLGSLVNGGTVTSAVKIISLTRIG
jgi:hypothetical protein